MNWILQIIKSLFRKQDTIVKEEFNLIPSPFDSRDVKASDIMGVSTGENPTPDECANPYVLTIKDQGSLPICVGASGATMNEYQKRRQKLAIEFDEKWLYSECKKIDGIPNVKGTYFRAVLSVLKNKGAKPVGGTEEDAKNYKIGGYCKVENDFDSIKRAIWKWGISLMGFYIYSNGSWNNEYIKIPNGSRIVNGHATVGESFSKQFVKGQNSAGKDWGDKGYFYVPNSYLPFEVYAIVSDIPVELLPDQNKKPKVIFSRNMFEGIRNDDVVALQDCLKWLGCMKKTQKSTGYFGNLTKAATIVFQQRYSIFPQSGFAGPLTRTKLNELFQ